jgi:hypothetical protein
LKKRSWFRVAALLALGTPLALAMLRPHILWAQGDGPRVFLALATGSQETPSVDSTGVAFGRFVLSADKKQLTYAIRISGLKGQFTAMQLHRGRPNVAGDAIYNLSPPTDNRSQGVLNFNAADEADLGSQGIYLNIQTDQQPGGEIRGQLVPSPDPAIGQEQEQPVVAEVSFAKEIQPIFNRNCSCHIGGFPSEGQNLGPGKALANIVNVKSRQSPLDRIEPGDPSKSYMIHKLNGTQQSVGGSGTRMPQGGAALPADQIAKISTWIQQGAKNN